MNETVQDTGDVGNKPVETLRDSALKVSIFRNQTDKGNFYTLVPGRIYTDEKTQQVRETSSLSRSEPLRMAQLLIKGYERVGFYREQDKERLREDRASKPSRSQDAERER